jgi:hypothetical protein
MNNVVKIKIAKAAGLTWVRFEAPDGTSGDRVETQMLSPDDCTLLAKELIAAALELISIK